MVTKMQDNNYKVEKEVALEKLADDINRHIGIKLGQARIKKGKTRQEVADESGVRPKQIERYESGEQRVSASRLFIIGDKLEKSISYFYEGHELFRNQPNDISKETKKLTLDAMECFLSVAIGSPEMADVIYQHIRNLSEIQNNNSHQVVRGSDLVL